TSDTRTRPAPAAGLGDRSAARTRLPNRSRPAMSTEAPRLSDPPLPRARTIGPRGLMRRVYTSNPFYVISALLVFLGLRASFDARGPAVEAGALMLGLAAYTLLLAGTAVFLVRRGKVWDD